jgi:hypothetical protein
MLTLWALSKDWAQGVARYKTNFKKQAEQNGHNGLAGLIPLREQNKQLGALSLKHHWPSLT